jgi:hypothetical protein
MPTPKPRSAVETCREAVLGAVRSQWTVLGGQSAGPVAAPQSIVDPEALLLYSCAARDDEPGLWDFVSGLLAVAPSLLSVQRTRNLAAHYHDRVRPVLAEAAAIAVRDGKDARWQPLAAAAQPRAYHPRKVYQPAGRVGLPAALMVRLRLAFGVHARSDVLAFLLGISPASATAREVAEAIGYGPTPARRALEGMATARIVSVAGSRPERYRVDVERWAALLGGTSVPRWRYWQPLFAFLAAALPARRRETTAARSPFLQSSEERQLVLAHGSAFALNRIAIPEHSDYVAEEYLVGFERTLLAVAGWVEASP